ncbi:MAG: GTP-binding protein [Bdellovibrionota bacterium]
MIENEPVVTLGIFAHANAGKTTITEKLLCETNEIKQPGKVDEGTTVTDNLKVEKERGISVRSALVNFKLPSLKKVQLIDTPGHIDFSAEVERAVSVLDAGILVVSGVEGVEAQTYTIWEALIKKNVPVIIFINKMDRKGASFNDVIKQLQDELSEAIVPIVNIKINNEKIILSDISPMTLLDKLSEFDDECVEMYMKCSDSKTFPEKKWLEDKIKDLLEKQKIFPVIGGSALQGDGIKEFVLCLDKFLPTFKRNETDEFSAIVYSIRVDKTEDLYVKILSGSVRKRQMVRISDEETQKITDIKVPSVLNNISVESAKSGDVVILNGLTVPAGTTLGNAKIKPIKFVKPLLNMSIKSNNMLKVVEVLRILQKEDPYLEFHYNKLTSEITISLMGEVQAQVIEQIAKERFNLEIQMVNPTIICKETPQKIGKAKCSYTKVSGLELEIEPLAEGSGFIFESKIPTGTLLRKYQRQVERLIMQYKEQGLYGWTVSDAKVSLVDGYFDSMGSQTLDFNIATPIAFFRALRNANTKILEPVCKFSLKAEEKDIGTISTRLEIKESNFRIRTGLGKYVYFEGTSRLENILSFQNEISKLTSGKGEFIYELHHYQECIDQSREIPFIGFDPRNEANFVVNQMGASMVPLDAVPTKKKNTSSKYAWKKLKKSLDR